jgi:exopolysaccharide biosynthesis protein
MRNFHGALGIGLAFTVLAGGCATNTGRDGQGATPSNGYTVLVEGIGHRQIVSPAPFPKVSQIVEVDLSKGRFALRLTRGDTAGGKEYRSQTTSTYARQTGAVIGVNAGFFGPVVDAEGVAMDAAGFVVADGVVTSPPLIPEADSAVVKAVVCFAVRYVIIEDTKSCPPAFREGLAAGPRLLRDGVVAADPANTTRHPRTALGISARGDKVWFVVTDGRQAGYSEGATLTEMADLLKGLGAINAINLDGGGSSAIVFADPQSGQRVLNRPIQNGSPGRERPVATHIGVFSVSSARN